VVFDVSSSKRCWDYIENVSIKMNPIFLCMHTCGYTVREHACNLKVLASSFKIFFLGFLFFNLSFIHFNSKITLRTNKNRLISDFDFLNVLVSLPQMLHSRMYAPQKQLLQTCNQFCSGMNHQASVKKDLLAPDSVGSTSFFFCILRIS